MLDRRTFVKKGLIDAIGKMPDYWVVLNAYDYRESGVLIDEDLLEIKAMVEGRVSDGE